MIFKVTSILFVFSMAISCFGIINVFTQPQSKQKNRLFLIKDIIIGIVALVFYVVFEFVLQTQYLEGIFVPAEVDYYIQVTLFLTQLGFLMVWYFGFWFNLKQNSLVLANIIFQVVVFIGALVLSYFVNIQKLQEWIFLYPLYAVLSVIIICNLIQLVFIEIQRFQNKANWRKELYLAFKAILQFIGLVLMIVVLVAVILQKQSSMIGKLYFDWINYGYLIGISLLWIPQIMIQILCLFMKSEYLNIFLNPKTPENPSE